MDDMTAENNQRHFEYLGCSGALTDAIKDKQVPKMQKSQAVLLSAGGNDAHLSTILNYCVTRFNDLTDLVNQKIQDACKTVDRCVYVDSEPGVDQNRGRYCMPGINEKYYGGIDSPVDGWNRERTVFYEWSTTKDDDEDGEKTIDQPEKRDESNKRGEYFISLETRSDTPGALNNDTFEGAIGNWIIQGTRDGTLN
ncbi:MAG: hypothetical protein Q9181_006251, partial [Wetmoreana brouardii]